MSEIKRIMKWIMMRFLFAVPLGTLAVSVMAQQVPPQTFNIYSTPQPDQTFTDPAGNTTVFHTLGTAQNPVQTGTLTFTPAAPPPPAANIVVSNDVPSSCSGSGTSCAGSSTNVVSGHSYIIRATAYGGSAQLSSITDSASLLGSCAVGTGARTPAAAAYKVEIWKCTATGSGATAIKTTWNGVVSFSSLESIDVTGIAGDDGKGNSASGSGTSASVATNGGTTQDNELIVAAVNCESKVITAGSGYTIGTSNAYIALEYSTANTAGPNTASFALPNNGTSSWGMAVAAFKHS